MGMGECLVREGSLIKNEFVIDPHVLIDTVLGSKWMKVKSCVYWEQRKKKLLLSHIQSQQPLKNNTKTTKITRSFSVFNFG